MSIPRIGEFILGLLELLLRRILLFPTVSNNRVLAFESVLELGLNRLRLPITSEQGRKLLTPRLLQNLQLPPPFSQLLLPQVELSSLGR